MYLACSKYLKSIHMSEFTVHFFLIMQGAVLYLKIVHFTYFFTETMENMTDRI